jgi:hypothetical protein
MDTDNVDWPMALAEARQHLKDSGGKYSPGADSTVTNLSALRAWIDEAAVATRERHFVITADDDETVDTLYLWLNEFVTNPDRWFLTAIGANHAMSQDDSNPPWSNRVGEEVADIRVPDFSLEGLEALQVLLAAHGPEAATPGDGPAERAVIAMVCDAITTALVEKGDIGFRVALSRGDEPRVVTWEHDGNSWTSGDYGS